MARRRIPYFQIYHYKPLPSSVYYTSSLSSFDPSSSPLPNLLPIKFPLPTPTPRPLSNAQAKISTLACRKPRNDHENNNNTTEQPSPVCSSPRNRQKKARIEKSRSPVVKGRRKETKPATLREISTDHRPPKRRWLPSSNHHHQRKLTFGMPARQARHALFLFPSLSRMRASWPSAKHMQLSEDNQRQRAFCWCPSCPERARNRAEER